MKKRTCLSLVVILVFAVVFLGLRVSSLHAQGESAARQTRSEQQAGQTAEPERPTEENLSAAASGRATAADSQKEEKAQAQARPADEIVVKTYSLKYIGWRDLVEATRLYLVQWTGADNTLTVSIRKGQIPDFEAALRKLDVEKKNIMFRVFTIIAARDNAPDIIKKPETKDIDNRDLKVALDELRGLWNFKRYWVDAPSFLTVKDGSGGSHVKLVSGLLDYADFGMSMRNVRLTGDEPGKRNITVGELKLDLNVNAPNVSRSSTLIDTQEISVKENGYLIVGVSGLETGWTDQSQSWSGLALILVISAEIKP